jgi:hypothetical protein
MFRSRRRHFQCDQMMRCAEVLTPLYGLMCRRVKVSYALHAHDTPVVLLNPAHGVCLGLRCRPG